MKISKLIRSALAAALLICSAKAYAEFKGEKSVWHGFDRYDYVMDEQTLEITPIKKDEKEGMGVAGPEKGKRRCIVVVPKKAAEGNPWTWRGCYWDHEPQSEVELLKRGFHVAYITTNPDKTWDAWHEFLVKKHGLSAKAAFIGMSRGGSNAYTWGTNNPDKVFAICADNPGLSQASLLKVHLLAEHDVPLLHVCGSIDPIYYNTVNIQSIYHAVGGRMSVHVKDGYSHHPHSLRSPKVIADFIEKSFQEKEEKVPDFLPNRYTKAWFYGTVPAYSFMKSQNAWVSTWGPEFAGAYRQYSFNTGKLRWLQVYAPQTPAKGMPWVYRADLPERVSAVDLALLEKGYHIVVGPTTTSIGPVDEEWDELYAYFTERGFSKKPVMAGRGGATGEAYNWAARNPDKVSCIYGENPIMRANRPKVQPMDNLEPLAKADVPILHVCGSLDPNLESQTMETQKRYKALGGNMTVIIDEGKGHYPLSPINPAQAIDFILSKTK